MLENSCLWKMLLHNLSDKENKSLTFAPGGLRVRKDQESFSMFDPYQAFCHNFCFVVSRLL
jgi:hypothetical protein